MIFLVSHLFGELGEHLEDGQAEAERLDGGGDVSLRLPGLHKLFGSCSSPVCTIPV